MSLRIALANLAVPRGREDALAAAAKAIAESARRGAEIVCFPECFVPGYRVAAAPAPAADPAFLERAWSELAAAAGKAGITAIVGTERVVDGARRLTALVAGPAGGILGFQDKVQLDPSEEELYAPGVDRRVFQAGPATFGVVICHEGWRYPETVRWAVRRGAQIVFHPHFDEAKPGAYPAEFGDPANSFHEKAMLCRAAENTCYFASVNCAGAGSATTSAIARPDGTLLAHQPYGEAGLLVADLDLGLATGLLAKRLRPGA